MPFPALPLAELPQVCGALLQLPSCPGPGPQARLLQTQASLIPIRASLQEAPIALHSPHESKPQRASRAAKASSAGSQIGLVENPVLHARGLMPAPWGLRQVQPQTWPGAGGLAVTQDEVEHPLPSMPCLRAQPDSVATKSKHVANVLSEYVSRGAGQETEPETQQRWE